MDVQPVSQADLKDLEFIAFDVLQPLYGDQTKALSEWLTGKGYKRAFLGKDSHGQSQAFLSLKINPAKDYVKISTFFVMPQAQGNGVGKSLLLWMLSYVSDHTSSKYLKVTVSEDKPESLAFFQKHGFTVVDQVDGKYVEGKTEFILQKELLNEKVS